MGGDGRSGDDGGLRQQDIDLVRRQQIEQDQHAADQRAQRSEDEQRARDAERERLRSGHSVVDELRGDEPLVGIGRNEKPTLTYGMLQRAFGDAMARRLSEDPMLLFAVMGSGLFLVSFILLFQALHAPDLPARPSPTPTVRVSASPTTLTAVTGRPTALPNITINASALARIEEIQRDENWSPNIPLALVGVLVGAGGAGVIAYGRKKREEARG